VFDNIIWRLYNGLLFEFPNICYNIINKTMKIPLAKLKAVLRYFYTNTDKRLLGKTKLTKLFYFADFSHVKNFGIPITYDTYINLEHGPVPSKILNLLNSVIDDPENAILSDTIQINNKEIGTGNMQIISCLSDFSESDKKYFSKNELMILENVCRKYYQSTAGQLEDISHREAPWLKTRKLDEIPYALAAADSDSLVTADIINLSIN